MLEGVQPSMIRRFTSLFLLLLTPGAIFAAEGDTAVRRLTNQTIRHYRSSRNWRREIPPRLAAVDVLQLLLRFRAADSVDFEPVITLELLKRGDELRVVDVIEFACNVSQVIQPRPPA